MKKLFEDALAMSELALKTKPNVEVWAADEEEEELEDVNIIPHDSANSPPEGALGIREDFNVGKSVEWRKSKYKWSMSERALNAIVGRLNTWYYDWKGNLKWYQERNGRWNLYFINPENMHIYINQIEKDLETFKF